MKIVQKNDHSSKSVCSFDSGPIFPVSLGQDISRNVFVVSFLFPGRNPDRRKDFFLTPKNVEISPIFEVSQNRPESFEEASRVLRK